MPLLRASHLILDGAADTSFGREVLPDLALLAEGAAHLMGSASDGALL